MFKDVPAPIRTTFWKYTLLYCAIVMFGLIWGIVIEDADFLYLTTAIAALGAWRMINLFKIIHHARYRTLEGVVVADVKGPLSSGHCLTLQLEDGSQITEVIAGKPQFFPMRTYRIYLYCNEQSNASAALPDLLKPAQMLIGFEMIE